MVRKKEKGKRKKNLISLCDLLETRERKNKLNDANPFTFTFVNKIKAKPHEKNRNYRPGRICRKTFI